MIERREAICSNCGAAMPATGHRACEGCRAEWRRYGRKPGGPAEQKELLGELVAATKDIVRMLEAVRLSAGLGNGQVARLVKAKTIVAKAEEALRQ